MTTLFTSVQNQNTSLSKTIAEWLIFYRVQYQLVEESAISANFRCQPAKKYDHRFPSLQLFPHQIELIQKLPSGKNLILTADPGTGKTIGAVFAIIPHLVPGEMAQLLVLLPSAQQIQKLYKFLTENVLKTFGLAVQHWVRDLDQVISSPQAEIILTTPAFFLSMFLSENHWQSQFSFYFQAIKYLIFDDIHRYSHSKIALLSEVFMQLKPRQMVWLSAMTTELRYQHGMTKSISSINQQQTLYLESLVPRPAHDYFLIPRLDMKKRLRLILETQITTCSTLIFTNSWQEAQNLSKRLITTAKQESSLSDLQTKILVLHNRLSYSQLQKFKSQMTKPGLIWIVHRSYTQKLDVQYIRRIIHLGLPRRSFEFRSLEQISNFRLNSDGAPLVSIILPRIPQNPHDQLLISNVLLFKSYLEGSLRKLLLIPNSPARRLYRLLICVLRKKVPTGKNDLKLLKQLHILEKIPTTSKFKLGKNAGWYFQNYLKLFTIEGASNIPYVNSHNKIISQQIILPLWELLLRFQPGTLHSCRGYVQQVLNQQLQTSKLSLAFQGVKDQTIRKYFVKYQLRSFVDFTVIIKYLEKQSPKRFHRNEELFADFSELLIVPQTVTYSYFNPETYSYILHKQVSAKEWQILILASFIQIPFQFPKINMEMAVHCLIFALRIYQDLPFKGIYHSINRDKSNPRILDYKLVLYEPNLAGLLHLINGSRLMQLAEQIFHVYLSRCKIPVAEAKTRLLDVEVLSLPTCRYLRQQGEQLSYSLIIRSLNLLQSVFQSI